MSNRLLFLDEMSWYTEICRSINISGNYTPNPIRRYNGEKVKIHDNNYYDLMGMCGCYDKIYKYHWLCDKCGFLNFYDTNEQLKSYLSSELKEVPVRCICCGEKYKISYSNRLKINVHKSLNKVDTRLFLDKPTYMHYCEKIIRSPLLSDYFNITKRKFKDTSWNRVQLTHRMELDSLMEASCVTKPYPNLNILSYTFKDSVSVSCLSLGGLEILKEYLVKIFKELKVPYDISKLSDLELYNPLNVTGKSIVVVITHNNRRYTADYSLLDYEELQKIKHYPLFNFIYERRGRVLDFLTRLSEGVNSFN